MASGQPGTRRGGPVTLGQHVPPVRGSSATQLHGIVKRGDIGLVVPDMATFQEKLETHIVKSHDSYLLAAVPHIKKPSVWISQNKCADGIHTHTTTLQSLD